MVYNGVPLSVPGKTPYDTVERLVHKLQSKRVEFEMQNEELRRAQGEIEESRADMPLASSDVKIVI